MQSFLHDENSALYRKLIAKSEGNPSRDEDRHDEFWILADLAKSLDRRGRYRILLLAKGRQQRGDRGSGGGA